MPCRLGEQGDGGLCMVKAWVRYRLGAAREALEDGGGALRRRPRGKLDMVVRSVRKTT